MILSGEVNNDMLAVALVGASEYFLCTQGGDTDIARAVADLMLGRAITAGGTVASSGIPIFAAAARRLALPSTIFLWHRPYATDLGVSRGDDLAVLRHGLDGWYDWACTLLGETTQRSAEFWSQLGAKAGTEFTAYDALEYGLCHGLTRQLSDTLLQSVQATHHAMRGHGDSGHYDGDLGKNLTRQSPPPVRRA
jgi:hypothetical protein